MTVTNLSVQLIRYSLPDYYKLLRHQVVIVTYSFRLPHNAIDPLQSRRMTLRFVSVVSSASHEQMQYYSILQSGDIFLDRRNAPNLHHYHLVQQLMSLSLKSIDKSYHY